MDSHVHKISPIRYCSRIISVNVEIRIINLTVYVLGKYLRGSCQYKAIIEHELKHVTIFLLGINNLEQKFKNSLPTIINSVGPGIGSSSQQANKIVFEKLRAKILQASRPIEKKMKVRNRSIDTPLSYKLLKQQCRWW
jgi:hypothetical protein